MEKRDIAVMCYLRQNARLPLTHLAHKTGLPVSTLFDRLRTNQKTLVKKYTALLNFDALGFSTKAHILLKAKERKTELTSYLLKHPNVNSLYGINNGWDLMAECVFRSMKELEVFVEKIEQEYAIKAREIHYVIEELKKEAFLTDPDLIDLVVPEHTKV